MKHFYLIAALAFAAPALAATTVNSPAYSECTQLASTNPTLAFKKAEEWLKIEQSVNALHCRAMALYGLKRYEEAGLALTDLRMRIQPDNLTLRTFVTRQAAAAWVKATRADTAIDILGQQVSEMTGARGNNVEESRLATELLLDRAELRLNFGQMVEAVQDLDHAVSLSPLNENVLIARADAFKRLGDHALAGQDLDAVLRINPRNAKAQGLRDSLPKQ